MSSTRRACTSASAERREYRPANPGRDVLTRAGLRSRWGALSVIARCGLVAYAIGFTDGTGAHVRDLVRGGVHAYAGFGPPVVQVFFLALVIIDPIVVALVISARPVGVWAAVIVMVADYAANLYANRAQVRVDWEWLVRPSGALPLTFFFVFVLVTAVPLARRVNFG